MVNTNAQRKGKRKKGWLMGLGMESVQFGEEGGACQVLAVTGSRPPPPLRHSTYGMNNGPSLQRPGGCLPQPENTHNAPVPGTRCLGERGRGGEGRGGGKAPVTHPDP